MPNPNKLVVHLFRSLTYAISEPIVSALDDGAIMLTITTEPDHGFIYTLTLTEVNGQLLISESNIEEYEQSNMQDLRTTNGE
jgi:hypothetical protein